MKELVFYETKMRDGSLRWWTQRNNYGICFLIRTRCSSKKFKLLVNGEETFVPFIDGRYAYDREISAAIYDTFIAAEKAANEIYKKLNSLMADHEKTAKNVYRIDVEVQT